MGEVGLLDLLAVVLTFVFGLVVGRFRLYGTVKRKLVQLERVLASLLETMNALNRALEDDKLTKDEVLKIIEKVKDLRKELYDLL